MSIRCNAAFAGAASFFNSACLRCKRALCFDHQAARILQIDIVLMSGHCECAGMTQTVQLPLWLFILILLFAAVTALSHFLLPSVRWFFRRRLERAVARLNTAPQTTD